MDHTHQIFLSSAWRTISSFWRTLRILSFSSWDKSSRFKSSSIIGGKEYLPPDFNQRRVLLLHYLVVILLWPAIELLLHVVFLSLKWKCLNTKQPPVLNAMLPSQVPEKWNSNNITNDTYIYTCNLLPYNKETSN